MLLKVLLISCFVVTIQANVIIVGAGSAGIAAATKLLENGVTNITILEAENRIGGRVHTIKFGANVQDLGAQWCYGETKNVVFELASPLGLLEPTKYNYNHFDYINSKGEVLPSEKIYNITQNFIDLTQIPESSLNEPLGEVVTKIYNKYVSQPEFDDLDADVKKCLLEVIHLQWLSNEASNSWFELSTKGQVSYNELEGSQLNSWKGRGFHTILDVMMKKIPDPSQDLQLEQKIELNKEVTKILWDNPDGLVKLECQDGSNYSAERVIFTASLGVLKAQELLFSPKLPQNKINAINTIGFGSIGRIVIEFPYQWWPNTTDGYVFIWSKYEESPDLQSLFTKHVWLRDIVGFYPYDYQPNNLIGWIMKESAAKMEQVDQNIVQEAVMALFRLLLGNNYTIPEPKSFLRTQWNQNQHFRGVTSFISVAMDASNTSNADLAEPVYNSNNQMVLQFAGEATHSTRYATVDGAIETGWREANRILNHN